MSNKYPIKVVDLFCGIGGLSYGLAKAGLEVVAGIDNDETCRFGYEYNNGARFIHKDIKDITADEINMLFGQEKRIVRVLAGCAPCQPFSQLNIKGVTKKALEPVERFAELIAKTLPEIVSMENVSGLAKTLAFKTFLATLDRKGYKYWYDFVDASEYGVPQRRKRLVLLASRLGEIKLVDKTHANNKVTVRNAIGHFEPISDGEVHKNDRLHRARKLSPTNMRRIKATPRDGGNSKSWDDSLLLDCHKRDSGKTYKCTVYGRMRWDEPSPTMTTQCVGLGNGRFGHPDQDRAISLREAATLQTFPKKYKFIPDGQPLIVKQVAKFIGNAVPVRLGKVIGDSIVKHAREYV